MKTLFITTALVLFAAPALAETKSQWGCEWKQGDNGNYWTKVDGGCKHWVALGYATQASMNKDVPPAIEDDSEEPSDPGDGGEGPGDGGGDEGAGPGEGPGDEGAGPGDDGGNGAGPDGNGGGNEGPGTEGPSKPGKPGKPGKGKGRR